MVSLLIFGANFLAYIFQVKTVFITGEPKLFTNSTIFTQKRNILLLNAQNFSEEIKKAHPLIKEIIVTKRYPNTLYVRVTERVPVAVYDTEAGPLFIDAEGIVLSNRGLQLLLPVLNCQISERNPGEQVVNSTTRAALDMLSKLINNQIQVLSARCSEEGNTVIVILIDTQFLFSATQNNNKLLSSLQFLLKQFRIEGNRPHLIDLRFDKPVLIPEVVLEASPASVSGGM